MFHILLDDILFSFAWMKNFAKLPSYARGKLSALDCRFLPDTYGDVSYVWSESVKYD